MGGREEEGGGKAVVVCTRCRLPLSSCWDVCGVKHCERNTPAIFLATRECSLLWVLL